MRVVGVDGCPGGWLTIAYEPSRGALSPSVHADFSNLLEDHADADCIAVDIPIGLAEGFPRLCDLAARQVLGAPRSSSVFPAPDRRLLDTPTYDEALRLSHSLLNKGVSKQGFAIYRKIAEVDQLMTPALQERVIELHPEVSFWALAGGRSMEHPKRKALGFEERRMLLFEAFTTLHVPSRIEARTFSPPAKPDDVLDALVAVWTALRHAEGSSERLPREPAVDSKGLRMEIVY